MAAPRAPVNFNNISEEEHWKLFQSPLVKIIAGKQGIPEYTIPRDLIGFYSPYFAGCFRPGAFKEGCEGVLRLENENSQHVELLLRYIRTEGTAQAKPMDLSGAYMWSAEHIVHKAIEFIQFCERYDVCEASAVVSNILKRYIPHCRSYIAERFFTVYKDEISFIFRSLHYTNPCLKPFATALARTVCQISGDSASVNKFLVEPMNYVVAGHVMREMLRMGQTTGRGIMLKREVKPRTKLNSQKDEISGSDISDDPNTNDFDDSDSDDSDSDDDDDDEDEEAMQT